MGESSVDEILKIDAYNSAVSEDFQLPFKPNTLAVLLISSPKMFDISFAKWIREKLEKLGTMSAVSEAFPSPIAQFLDDRLEELYKNLSYSCETIHDHHLWPNRRPKILMQTCGHVAGAAFYYQPKNFQDENWPPSKPMDKGSKFIGLSLHPVYGGHFAFRSVLIFPEAKIENSEKSNPGSILEDPEEIKKMLEEFNFNWRTSGFRDFGNPKHRYSPEQVAYFGLAPAERWAFLESWLVKGN
ncbi:hypothetical protein WR25_04522 [Diploscapter pachys]|uniref:Cyanocobalamin reductase (cyanide-eliminating) n=1 Tax=Diploscapter pachys TaxID=2018661 RepID=A0A2A2LG32_9BILA|nr:hypothetical protein WR25_04522 [Diploscapter pachys]